MDLRLPITIVDELSEGEVRSHGELDLASGEIRKVQYEGYDAETEGLPADRDDYEFTLGVLSNGSREVEFKVMVDKAGGRYFITPTELLELKGRAARLFTQAPRA